jgi:hypothetical protein
MLLSLLLALACAPSVCGTAEHVFVYPGGEGEQFDTDADGDADLVEHCGVDAGMFGYTRDDFGITELTLSPDAPPDTIEANGAMSTYILPAASVALLTSHFVVGEVVGIEGLAGSGLHKLGGTAGETYATYDLLDGALEVLDGPKESTDPVYEGYASWKLRWQFTFGDPMNGMELQRWDAEDWVQIGPGDTIGDPLDLPPDWSPP